VDGNESVHRADPLAVRDQARRTAVAGPGARAHRVTQTRAIHSTSAPTRPTGLVTMMPVVANKATTNGPDSIAGRPPTFGRRRRRPGLARTTTAATMTATPMVR